MSLIGICGEIGSGKTTLATRLKTHKRYKEYSIAGPLKNIALNLGFKFEQVHGSQSQKLEPNKYWNISAREFLQKFGTDLCRDILPNVIPNMNMGKYNSLWVRLMEIEWDKLYPHFGSDSGYTGMVVSDVRFPDEAQSIQERGGIIIKIIRPIDKSGDEYKHSSETSINFIKPDKYIINDGSIDDLYQKIDQILKELDI